MAQKIIDNESRVRKIIFNEITLIIALVSLVSGVIFWVTNPQYDMELKLVKLESQLESNQTVVAALEQIKNNDFVEIEIKMNKLEARQVEILQVLAAINQQLLNK